MEFSELFQGKLAAFSPNGKFLSCICGDSVEIRYADTLLKAFKFECSGVVKVTKWSGDSLLVLCQVGASTLKVFSVTSGSCIASLKQQTGSLSQISWAADSRSVLYLEPFLFRVAVWKICDQTDEPGVSYFDNVSPWSRPSYKPSPNGKHVAVVSCGIMNNVDHLLETTNVMGKGNKNADAIVIFSAISWRQEKSVSCKGCQRVGGVEWSTNSYTVVTWPSDPSDAVLIICVRSGTVIKQWKSCNTLWPGVCRVDVSPSTQFMAVTSQRSEVHVINCTAWCEEVELVHDSSITDPKCVVYREASGSDLESTIFLELKDRPVSISFLSSLGKAKRHSAVAWSSGGRYLASCVALAPAVIWVWSTACSFRLCCVIVTKHPVKGFNWDPVHNVLSIVDGQDCVTFWNAEEAGITASSVCTPVSRMLFQANHLDWRHDGKVIAVSSEQNSAILDLCYSSK